VLAARAQHATLDTMRTLEQWGPLARVAQSLYGLTFYITKTMAPVRLAALYELPQHFSAAEPRWIASALAAGMLLLCAAYFLRRRTGFAIAILLYAVLLAPVLGLTQSGIQLVAERYAYFALIPLFALLAWTITRLPARLHRPAALAALLVAAILAVLSARQSLVWRDTEALWRQAIAHGQDGPVLRNYLARQLESKNEPDHAIEQYERSLTLQPTYGDSWLGLAGLHRKARRFDEARAAYANAIQHSPDPTRALIALGLMQVTDLADPAAAADTFAAAADACERSGNPSNTGTPYLLLGAALGEAGDLPRCIAALRRAATFADTRAQALEHLRDLGAPP